MWKVLFLVKVERKEIINIITGAVRIEERVSILKEGFRVVKMPVIFKGGHSE